MDSFKFHSPWEVLIIIIFAIRCLSSPLNYNPNPTPLVGSWRNVSCTDPIILNTTLDVDTRWNYADGNGAWKDAIDAWNANPNPNGQSFSQFITTFFRGPQDLECGVAVTPNTCSSTIQCSDNTYVAGYYIINSFVIVNNAHIDFYNGIANAEGSMTPGIGTFSSLFAIEQPGPTLYKQLFDAGSMVFTLFASPYFNTYIKSLSYFARGANPLTYQISKDLVSSLATQGMTLSKDTTTEAEKNGQLNTQNTISSNLGDMINIWTNASRSLGEELFNGSVASIDRLHSMIMDGRFMESVQNAPQPDDQTIQQYIKYAAYGLLIPQAWTLSAGSYWPFVLNSGYDCSSPNPLPLFISDDTAAKTQVCYNNVLYFFVGTKGFLNEYCATHGHEQPIMCTRQRFAVLPGVEELNGIDYGGVTLEQLLIGAVNGFHANNNNNGWPLLDPGTMEDYFDAFTSSGNSIETAGLIQIPVCSADIAYANWFHGDESVSNFPCNPNVPPVQCDDTLCYPDGNCQDNQKAANCYYYPSS